MSTAKKLALIAAGYALSVVGGLVAVAVNELLIGEEVAQTSGGMVAFGDVVLFLFVAGALGLAPTLFLLKLSVEKAPRAVLAAELLLAAIGPLSWLAVIHLTSGPTAPSLPQAVRELLGLLIGLVAIPRMVLGPVLLVIEAATFYLVRGRVARALLAVAMLMDLIPLGMFALHLARATRY
jgi:hypothetical protein